MVFAHEVDLVNRLEIVRSTVALTQPNAELMRVNPLSRIPTLVTDDGLVLFDSSLICEYLDSLHSGPKLYPSAGEPRWRALRWHALGTSMLEICILWRSELQRPSPAPAFVDACALKINASLDTLEREVEDVAPAPFGIGHVALGVALGYLDFRFKDLPWRHGRKRLAAWEATFAKRPSAQATLPRDE